MLYHQGWNDAKRRPILTENATPRRLYCTTKHAAARSTENLTVRSGPWCFPYGRCRRAARFSLTRLRDFPKRKDDPLLAHWPTLHAGATKYHAVNHVRNWKTSFSFILLLSLTKLPTRSITKKAVFICLRAPENWQP